MSARGSVAGLNTRYRRATSARRSALMSLTAASWQPGTSAKLRTTFGPQYP